MAKLTELKARDTGEVLYPKTVTTNVYTEDGQRLNDKLDQKADIEDLSNVLAEQVIDPPLLDEINLLTREEIKKDLFIDQWDNAWTVNNVVYGKYDPENAPDTEHVFRGNDIWMTYNEAITVMREYSGSSFLSESRYCNCISKTLPPITTSNGNFAYTPDNAFFNCANLEVICFNPTAYVPVGERMFSRCYKLRKIINGAIRGSKDVFSNLPLLEYLMVRPRISLNFSESSKLNYESILYKI